MTTQAPKSKAIPERSAETELLLKRLKKLKAGEVVPYDELNTLIDGDVQGKQYGLLGSARRAAISEDQIVTECVRKVGVKRMDNDGILTIGPQSRKRIHRIAKRTAKKTACADYDSYNTEQKLQWNLEMSAATAIAEVTKERSMQKLKSAVSMSQERLPLNKTLEAFKT